MEKSKVLATWVIFILGSLAFAFVAHSVYKEITKPVFTLSSDSVVIEAGEEFEPSSYISSIKNANISDILIDNPVQTGILGEYVVSYEIGLEKASLTVEVVDTTPPVLKIATGELAYFTDENITLDSLIESVNDGTDLSLYIDTCNQDISVAGDYTIKVVAIDAGGNETARLARVHIKNRDTTPPEILDLMDITITEGDSLDLINGIIIIDDIDESPSLIINADGFDKNTPGEYIIYYTAKDETGNEITKERRVTVNPKIVIPVITPLPEGYVPFVGDVKNFVPTGGSVGWDATGVSGQPYLVCVNRAMCTVTVYGMDTNGNYTIPVKAMACSVGREGHETITGRYKTQSRYEWCYMVDGTWGRYAIRISGGYMFHSIGYFNKSADSLEYDEFNKLGNPASLGCVRLCLSDIYWLYAYCPSGFPTVIYDDYEFAGPLGKPTPPTVDTSNEATRNWDPTDPEYPFN